MPTRFTCTVPEEDLVVDAQGMPRFLRRIEQGLLASPPGGHNFLLTLENWGGGDLRTRHIYAFRGLWDGYQIDFLSQTSKPREIEVVIDQHSRFLDLLTRLGMAVAVGCGVLGCYLAYCLLPNDMQWGDFRVVFLVGLCALLVFLVSLGVGAAVIAGVIYLIMLLTDVLGLSGSMSGPRLDELANMVRALLEGRGEQGIDT
jgi:hypothetical protein